MVPEKRSRPPRVTRSDTAQQEDCDVIGDLIGHYGKWQFVMTILLSLFQIPNTFHISSPLYQVSESPFRAQEGVKAISDILNLINKDLLLQINKNNQRVQSTTKTMTIISTVGYDTHDTLLSSASGQMLLPGKWQADAWINIRCPRLFQSAMKEYWCDAPAHLQSLPIELWRNISQTEDGCQMFDYPWNTVTAADISVGLLNSTIPLLT